MKFNSLVRDLAGFLVMAAFVFLLWKQNAILTAILGTLMMVALLLFYNNTERLFFVFSGVFGVVLEIIGSFLGIWTYTFPNLVTVPFWIFFSWGFTFMLFNTVYLKIRKKVKET